MCLHVFGTRGFWEDKPRKHTRLPIFVSLSKNETWPRNGSPRHRCECRPLNWPSFFAEHPLPATPGPKEAQKVTKIATNSFHVSKSSRKGLCVCGLFSPRFVYACFVRCAPSADQSLSGAPGLNQGRRPGECHRRSTLAETPRARSSGNPMNL